MLWAMENYACVAFMTWATEICVTPLYFFLKQEKTLYRNKFVLKKYFKKNIKKLYFIYILRDQNNNFTIEFFYFFKYRNKY